MSNRFLLLVALILIALVNGKRTLAQMLLRVATPGALAVFPPIQEIKAETRQEN